MHTSIRISPLPFTTVRTLAFAWTLVALLCYTGCIVNFDDDDFDFDNSVVATESFSFEVDATTQTRIRLEGINGNVEMRGRAGAASIVVSGDKKVGSNTIRDAERRLDDLEVRINDRTDDVFVRTIQPQNTQGRTYAVDYILTLPADLEVSVDLVNGNVIVETLDNDVSVDNTNGNVRLEDIAGSARVDLTNGNVVGDIILPLDGTIDLSTTNGNIDLGIPATTTAAFSARVTNGTISTSNLDLKDTVRTNRSLSGTLGDGDGSIELRTVNGNIRVEGF